MNKLYILIEPNLISYDKVCTKEAVYKFAYEIADDLEDKDILEQAYNRNDKSKDGTDYFDNVLTMLLQASGYEVVIKDDGIYSIEDYWNDLERLAPEREDTQQLLRNEI